MKRLMRIGSLALFAAAAIAGTSGAVAQSTAGARPAAPAGTDEVREAAYVRVAQQLRCPVCQQLSILDSPAELAVEMRAVVRERLAAGDSEEAVLQYFVSKYGQWVLLDPPKEGFNLVVWLGPLVVLLGGAAVLAVVFRGWLRSPAMDEPAASTTRSTAA